MSTNVSKQKREQLIAKIAAIRTAITKAPNDENTGNLLTYLADLEKEVKGKKYGLVFEEHRESIDEILETHTPVLSEEPDLFIDNGGQINFIIEGDNLAALQLLLKTHKGRIDVIYIDPPYNTGAKDWKYDNDYVDKNDTFRHSKWLSMMDKRLRAAKKLLKSNGVLILAIDENEQDTVSLLLKEIFGIGYDVDCITIVHNPRGVQGKNFSYIHEYALFVHKTGLKNIGERKVADDDIDWSPLRNWGGESLRTDARNCFYPIIVENDEIVGFGDVSKDDYHPAFATVQEGARFLCYPIDRNGVERKWRYARQSVEAIWGILKAKKTKTGYEIVMGKKTASYKTVWTDTRYDANQYGTQIVNALSEQSFDFPKSLWNVYDCLYAVIGSRKQAVVLDFFAGSGTTGHAVLEINKHEVDGQHRFILATNNENGICRNVTYPRIKNAIVEQEYAASLKYIAIDFVPISNRLYYEYADDLLRHIRELVELENGINFVGNAELAIVLTDEEMDAFVADATRFAQCKKLYKGHDVILSAEQETALKKHKIAIYTIPDYYYKELEA